MIDSTIIHLFKNHNFEMAWDEEDNVYNYSKLLEIAEDFCDDLKHLGILDVPEPSVLVEIFSEVYVVRG